MSRREYFVELGEDVAEEFDNLVASGKTPEDASGIIVAKEYVKINRDLSRFKNKAGLPLNENAEELKKMKTYAGNIGDI